MLCEAPPQHELLDIIGAIYEATADPGKWGDVLARLAHAFGGTSAQIVHASGGGRHVDFAALHNPGPTSPTGASVGGTGGDPGLSGLAVYRRLMDQKNRDQALLSCVTDDEDKSITGLGILRDAWDEPFSQPQWAAFDAIIPHVCRAVAIYRRMVRLAGERDGLRGAVDRLPLGIVLVDASAQVLFANAAAREMAGDGLVLSAGRMAVSEPADGSRLRTALAALTRGGVAEARVLTVTRPSGHRALTLLLSPVPAEATPFGDAADGPAAAIYISDPERECAGAIEVLRSLFALTPVEAEVLEMLVRGFDPPEIARRRGTCVSTIRHHLKSIFRKTATARQADLVRLVTTGPAWLRH